MEKRRYKRLPSSIPCRWQNKYGDFSGEVMNISFDGVCIGKTPELPRVGSEVLLTLYPGKQDIRLWGEVKYSGSSETNMRSGVQFMTGHQETIEKLLPLLNSHIDSGKAQANCIEAPVFLSILAKDIPVSAPGALPYQRTERFIVGVIVASLFRG